MAGVPHLIELNDKYRENGFEIVAVSDEAVGTLEGFIKSKSPTYGIVNAKNVITTYGGKGYPSAWVLDTEGKCIWAGHPGNITDAMVAEWIKDLAPGKISKEVVKELKPAVEAYNKGQIGKAVTEVEKFILSEDEKVKADAEFVDSILDRRQAAGEGKATKLREAGELVKLVPLLEAEGKAFDGCEYGKKCAEEAKTTKASKEYKDCVKAQDAWAKLEPKLRDLSDAKAKKALEKFVKDYPNTPAAKIAEEKLKDYN